LRYVITGHRGFIGSRLTAELTQRGHSWRGLDWDQEHPGHNAMCLDLSRPNFFFRALRSAVAQQPVDAVIHLAAQPGRVFGEEDVERTIKLNVQMTAEVARACGELGVRLIYTSTSEVYGDPRSDWAAPPISHEDDEPRPKNLYGMTKLWGEQVSRLYAPDRLLVVRPTMPYGPGMSAGHGRAALPTFIWHAMTRQPIVVHEGAKRSWCYVDDMISGFVDVVERGELPIYNVGRDDDLRSMTEIAVMACEIVRAPTSLIEYAKADETITLVKNISTENLRLLGFEPQVDLEEGMRRTYEESVRRSHGHPDVVAVGD
jgi:dTDP-glucose 4,6-dehydratase